MSDFEGNFEIVGMPEVRVFSSVDASTEQPEKGHGILYERVVTPFQDSPEAMTAIIVGSLALIGLGLAVRHSKEPLLKDRQTTK